MFQMTKVKTDCNVLQCFHEGYYNISSDSVEPQATFDLYNVVVQVKLAPGLL